MEKTLNSSSNSCKKNFLEVNFLDIQENEEYVKLAESVLELAFKEEKLDKINIYINIILTNEANIKNINNTYRNINRETDVLSFPMFEKEELQTIIHNKKQLPVCEVLGDIIISIPKVEKQAKEYGHSFNRELAYMIIHGFYHLMGYDHIKEEEKKEMRAKEESILNSINITRNNI